VRVSPAVPASLLLATWLATGGAVAHPRHARARGGRVAAVIDVQDIGARAPAATDAMRARVRERVARHLRALTDEHLLTSPRGYVVDGSIESLVVVDRPDGVEISCAVRLILSARGSDAMLALSTGEATLRQPRGARRPPAPAGAPETSRPEERLELEALDGAVRAASDELVQRFESRRKS
jgi:hypothetical protein